MAEKEYIEREALMAEHERYITEHPEVNLWTWSARLILNAPAADVQPVVTCEECVWHVDDGCHNCTKLGMLCPDDAEFYCKYGRRPKCGAEMREES